MTGVVVWHWLVLVCRMGVWDWSLPMAAWAFQKLFVVLGVERARGNAQQGAPPCAPTPRAHAVIMECGSGASA